MRNSGICSGRFSSLLPHCTYCNEMLGRTLCQTLWPGGYAGQSRTKTGQIQLYLKNDNQEILYRLLN
ncbi:Neuromedin-K receptor [Dirofilaria immitis]